MKFNSFSIFCAIAFLYFGSCSSFEKQNFKEVRDLIATSNYDQAIDILEEEIDSDSKNPELLSLLGECYLAKSDYNKAEDFFQKAVSLDTNVKEFISDVYFDKSIAYYKKNEFLIADSLYEKGISYSRKKVDEFASKLFNYAEGYSKTTLETDSVFQLLVMVREASSAFDSRIADLAFGLSKLYINKGFVDQGLLYAQFGLQFDTKHNQGVAVLYLEQAQKMLEKGDKAEDALSLLDKSLELSSEKRIEISDVLFKYARVYETAKKYDQMFSLAKKCSELNSSYSNWYDELEAKYNPKVPTKGLIAYFPFNGNAVDEVNKTPCIVSGASLTSDRKGRPNRAYSFYGDYIETKNSYLSNVFSISFWFKTENHTDGWPNVGTFFSTSKSHGGWGNGVNGSISDNKILYGKYPQEAGWRIVSGEPNGVSNGKWHNAVFIWDGTTSSNAVQLFINGKLEITHKPKTTALKHDFNMVFGFGYDGPHKYYFKGSLDDIRIYDRVLSVEEIRALYKE